MSFAASLISCEKCGTRDMGPLELYGDGELWSCAMACPQCGTQRVFSFPTTGAPYEARVQPFELGDGPSTLISEVAFRDELACVAPRVVADPTKLEPPAWYASRDALRRALTCLTELSKLVAGSARSTLDSERTRLLEVVKAYASDGDRICDLDHSPLAPMITTDGTHPPDV